MNIWPKVTTDTETKVGWRTIVTKTFEQPDGKHAVYETKDATGKVSCAIIAVTQNYEIVTAEQFRPGPEKVLQELPGGGAVRNESYEEAALRELKEETGYEIAGSVEYLGKVYKDAYTNTEWHYFIGFDAKNSGNRSLDEGEFVDIKLISITQLIENARSAKMTDIEAVFLAYDKLKELM